MTKDSLLIYVCDIQGQPAEWIRIVPLGRVELRDTRKPFDVTSEDLSDIIQKFQADQIHLVVDYQHQSLGEGEAPAAGWIQDLEARPDGLYSRVNWTAKALKQIQAGEFRYYSPVIKLSRPMELKHAALTNTPALKGTALSPLLAARYGISGGDAGATGEAEIIVLKGPQAGTPAPPDQAAEEGNALPDGSFPIQNRADLSNAIQDLGRAQSPEAAKQHIIARAKALGCMDLLPADWPGSTKKMDGGKQAMKEKLLKVLALKAEATEAEAFAALESRLKMADSLPEIAVALGLPKDAQAAQITGTIVALKQGSEQLTGLVTEVAALKAENALGQAQKAVDEALAARKITPGQSAWALKYATSDSEGFKAYVAAAVPVLTDRHLEIPADDKKPGGRVDEAALAVCRQMGIAPADFLATKQDMDTAY